MEPGTRADLVRNLRQAESSTDGMLIAIASLRRSIQSFSLQERTIIDREPWVDAIRKEYREAIQCFETMQAYIERIDPTIKDGK